MLSKIQFTYCGDIYALQLMGKSSQGGSGDGQAFAKAGRQVEGMLFEPYPTDTDAHLYMYSVGWCRAVLRITDVPAHTETYYRPCAQAYDVETELHLTRIILICHSITHQCSLNDPQSSPPPHHAFYASANSDENCASATGETINGSRGSCLLKQLTISPVFA